MFSWNEFNSTVRNSAWENRIELTDAQCDDVKYYDGNGNVVAVIEPIDYPQKRIECSYKKNDGSWETTIVEALP